ncbi:Hypothetical predicted protein [Cloeon dipterum]|nr:Hypothetical predicted protein [Cloeon dipterum]
MCRGDFVLVYNRAPVRLFDYIILSSTVGSKDCVKQTAANKYSNTMKSICILLLLTFALAEAGFSYPGTHYCGPGNSAKGESQAKLNGVDKCCKTHDNCPIRIRKDEVKYGLKNTGLYTRCSCECDTALRNCLKKVGGVHATAVRKLFDTVGPTKCIKTSKTCISWSKG